ncbi:phospholipase D-like domain-containing protein [Tahibacter amnicola]|uniref:Phospholipase D-like domain-containing protein n=1 Tax=Tahibacter amnicola TaxID=2976241 RepID=A0ABY6B9D3_9GAMM|nr:phospholipase D-like domain-containing protein [Tahibacter amnicola]UXI66666.1 phospholipase D-like domain-containing protein [Tahibacter amnicola]
MTSSPTPSTPPATPLRRMAEQAFSRAAGAPLIGGNQVELLIDAEDHFEAWLAAIASARRSIFLENYIIRDDPVGRRLRDALARRAAAGVAVFVMRDWLGCLGQDSTRYWAPLVEAGGCVRTFNAPRLSSPVGWISRDHRKLLVIDNTLGFISGVCVSAKWLGDASSDTPPWRDTGVSVRGPAVAELSAAFADLWAKDNPPVPGHLLEPVPDVAGDMDVRVIATVPSTAGLFRLDQLIAAMARRRLWISDAYFVGLPPYVAALAAAARDGVDVRLLVPGASDIPVVARLSRAGYRPLLEAGIRVFEWNGSMMHAKTAVADSLWARVGSSNLNIASWMGNCEIDLAIEDRAFAQKMEEQFVRDLEQSTEIVLKPARQAKRQRRRRARGHDSGSGRAAASVMRLAHSVGAALGNQRVLGRAEAGALPWASLVLFAFSMIAILWPRVVAWPLAATFGLIGLSLFARFLMTRRATQLPASAATPAPPTVAPKS